MKTLKKKTKNTFQKKTEHKVQMFRKSCKMEIFEKFSKFKFPLAKERTPQFL